MVRLRVKSSPQSLYIGHFDKRVLNRYSEKLVDSRFRGSSPRDVATILNASVRLQFIDKELFSAASQYIQQLPSSEFVSEKHIGLIFNAFARAGISDIPLFDLLASRTESQLSSMSAQSCGNVCHAFGKLGLKGETASRLIPKISMHATSTLAKTISSQGLSNIIYSFGNLGIRDIDALVPLTRLIASKIRSFNAIEIAALVTALTKLAISDKPLMREIAKLVEKNASRFNAYEMTAVIHAFSQLNVPIPHVLFDTVAPSVLSASDMNSHTACIAFGSYARVGIIPSPSLMSVLSTLIKTESDAQYLINVLFGFGRLTDVAATERSLIDEVITKLLKRDIPPNPVNLNQLVYSMNKLGLVSTPNSAATDLYTRTLRSAIEAIPSFDGLQLSNLLYAIANRGTELLPEEQKLTTRLISRIAEMDVSPQLLSSIVESVARLGSAPPATWTLLETRLRVTVPDSAAIDVRNVESLAHASRLVGDIGDCLVNRVDVTQLTTGQLADFLYALVHARRATASVRSIVETAAKVCLEKIEDVKTSELKQIASLSNALLGGEVDVFPFNLYSDIPNVTEAPLTKRPVIVNEGQSALTDLSHRMDDCVAACTGSKVEYCLSQLECMERSSCPPVVTEIMENHLMSELKNTEHDLMSLARSVKYLSPVHDRLLSRLALAALPSYRPNEYSLTIASSLMKIDSVELRETIMDEYVPGWIGAETREDVLIKFVCDLGSIPLGVSAGQLLVEKLDVTRTYPLSVVAGIAPFLHVGMVLAPLVDASLPVSLTCVNDILTKCARYSKDLKSRMLPIILEIVPHDIQTVPISELGNYMSLVATAIKHDYHPKVQFSNPAGPTAVLRVLMISKPAADRHLVPALEVAIHLEDLQTVSKLVPRIVDSMADSHRSADLRKQFMQCVAILKMDNPEWYISELDVGTRRQIESVRKLKHYQVSSP